MELTQELAGSPCAPARPVTTDPMTVPRQKGVNSDERASPPAMGRLPAPRAGLGPEREPGARSTIPSAATRSGMNGVVKIAGPGDGARAGFPGADAASW